MYQFRLIVLYFVLIVLAVVVGWKLIDDSEQAYKNTELDPTISAEARSYELLTADRIEMLKDFSRVVLDSDLPVYVDALMGMKGTVKRMGSQTNERFTLDKQATIEHKMDYVQKEAGAELAEFQKKLGTEISTRVDVEGGVESKMTEILLSGIVGEYDWWDYSFFKVVYISLVEFVYPDILRRWDRQQLPDLFVLIEPEKNTTRYYVENLAAIIENRPTGQALDRELLAYESHRSTNFNHDAPVLKDIRGENGRMMSSGIMIRNNRAFVVVATRLENDDKELRGMMLVGYELDQDLAQTDTARVLGMRPILAQCLEELEAEQELASSSERCAYELSNQSRGVTLIAKDRIGKILVVGTSLVEPVISEVTDIIKTEFRAERYVTDDLMVLQIRLPVEHRGDASKAYAFITLNLDQALMPYTLAKRILIVVSLVLFFIGFILLQLLSRRMKKPFEMIDQGIHEIIGGNFDYQFPFDFSDELPCSMAQSLSVMKAVLLGEPLPEEADADDSWGEELKVEAEAFEKAEAGKAQDIESVSQTDIKETKTEYYRRLFKEFVEARKANGEDVNAVTYVRFIEKVARNEKALRERLGCKQVLFRVDTRDKQAILKPIKVREGFDDKEE